jgi:hypothetical protein
VLPALLTFFIRWFVPESVTWERAKREGATTGWATRDLIAVGVGMAACWCIILLWSQQQLLLAVRIAGTSVALIVIAAGYLFPVRRYFVRARVEPLQATQWIRRMLLGALISGIPLLGTWAAVQWAPTWADQLSDQLPWAKGWTQVCSSCGAIAGGFVGALLGGLLGRRVAYVVLCIVSLGSVWLFYGTNESFGSWFLCSAAMMGLCTASFYGWLPLYLPELFPTRVRATGQGFSYNFGRILAAIGALQTGAIMGAFEGGYPQACSIMGSIYLLGCVAIWLAPETKGQPLPE